MGYVFLWLSIFCVNNVLCQRSYYNPYYYRRTYLNSLINPRNSFSHIIGVNSEPFYKTRDNRRLYSEKCGYPLYNKPQSNMLMDYHGYTDRRKQMVKDLRRSTRRQFVSWNDPEYSAAYPPGVYDTYPQYKQSYILPYIDYSDYLLTTDKELSVNQRTWQLSDDAATPQPNLEDVTYRNMSNSDSKKRTSGKEHSKREFVSHKNNTELCSTDNCQMSTLKTITETTILVDITTVQTTKFKKTDHSHPTPHWIPHVSTVLLDEAAATAVPDTGNRHPDKIACEQLTRLQCLCYLDTAVGDLNRIVSNGGNEKVMLQELNSYNCSDYRPLDVTYRLSSDLKPRLLSKKQKELVIDDRNGPKEVISSTFHELLLRTADDQDEEFYVFPDTNLEIPCTAGGDIQFNTDDSIKYSWSHGNNKPITEGRFEEDTERKGLLRLSGVTVVDTDNYTCSLIYEDPDTDQTITNTYIHSVLVVSLPKFALQTPLNYIADVKCDMETLEMFELYIPQQIEESICSFDNLTKKLCTLSMYNAQCHEPTIKAVNNVQKTIWRMRSRWPRDVDDTSEESDVRKMEISLEYELDLSDIGQLMEATVNKSRCSPFCQLKILLKSVEILRDSLIIALTRPVKSSAGIMFTPDTSTMNVKLVIACGSGLKLYRGFCTVPCPLHTFSKGGNTECTQCQDGMYQPHIGSKSCEKCPHPFEPGCAILWTSVTVIVLTIVCIVLVILIVGFCLCAICRLCCGKGKKSKKSSKIKSSRDKTSLKKGSRRKTSHNDSERYTMAPLLPSEDFSESDKG